uniref:F-box/kelch-repeat protein At3g06240 family n=1 Tax=Cajanus cajan TaxID=3821 RepID=A0A151RUM9_CAJCA|nr:F-box/kelch-repeat protein At3g06240 family [Cajanus cajan]
MGEQYRIMGSCNGLLCLLNVHKHYMALWNPSIRITSKAFAFPTAISLYKSITYQGLGYDHVNDKYKLLVVAIDHHETVTKLYTFGANSWKVIQNLPCRPNRLQAKFVSGTGTLNWIARTSDGGRWMILSFDLVTETYGEVFLPGGDADHVSIPELVFLSNCLLCISFFDSKKDHWAVWQMKEYGVLDSWTKVMSIPHFNQGVCNWNGFTITPHSLVPLCISEDGIILFRTTFSKWVVYNPNDGSMACLGIRAHYWLNMHTYHQSLVSPQL